MKISWRTELPQLLIIAAMFLVAALVWQYVPDKMPVHWNFKGEVDRYGSKIEGLIAVPAVTIGLYLLLLLLPRLDPGYPNYERFSTPYLVIRYSMLIVMATIYGAAVLVALGYEFSMSALVPAVVGLMLIVLGNLMGKIRPNWFVGVRTPWTLSSKRSWDKTHRQAGWLFIVSGAALLVSGLLGTGWAAVSAFAILMLSTLWLVVYSYLVWRSDPDRVPPAGTAPHRE